LEKVFTSKSLDQTELAGRQIAELLSFPACVYLQGDMGAGKTTLAKSIIHGLGYSGAVTSPTYNLIQEYPIDDSIIYHMDLYRVQDAGELEFLALEDLWSASSLFLVEWAERGRGVIRAPDVTISISKLFRDNEYLRNIILKD